MTDLKSTTWIVAKGIMFLGIAVTAGALIIIETPSITVAALLALLVWASCRFYYFLFYVLERYVDPTMRYAGIWDLLMGMKRRRNEMRRDAWHRCSGHSRCYQPSHRAWSSRRRGRTGKGAKLDIDEFMSGYKAAWEQRDERKLCALFAADGVYCNTPFAEQRGHSAIAAYWQRVKLQEDIHLTYEVLARTPRGGIAHWHVTYQVASEELFRIWAASTGTNLLARKPGDPLPRLALDGILVAEFDESGLCRNCRLWWHSVVVGTPA